MKIVKNKLYKNIDVPLLKGDVRIMFDDGKGLIAMDFEKNGSLNKFLKEFVYKEFENMQKGKK